MSVHSSRQFSECDSPEAVDSVLGVVELDRRAGRQVQRSDWLFTLQHTYRGSDVSTCTCSNRRSTRLSRKQKVTHHVVFEVLELVAVEGEPPLFPVLIKQEVGGVYK